MQKSLVYSVLWTSAQGCEARSEDLLVNSISDTQPTDWRLYPNPASTFVNVFLTASGDVEVSDLSGRVVFSKSGITGTTTIDCALFAPGVYNVSVTSANGASSKLLTID